VLLFWKSHILGVQVPVESCEDDFECKKLPLFGAVLHAKFFGNPQDVA
jgi:hypothetical protein